MKRSRKTVVVFCFVFLFSWLMTCVDVPQDPTTNFDNATISIVIDSLPSDSDGVYLDTAGDSISFHFSRFLIDLVDSFAVEFDEDTTVVFSSEEFPEDTIDFNFAFFTPGSKVLSVTVYRTDDTEKEYDSAVVFTIFNFPPYFLEGKPDTLYEVMDNDSLLIPFEAEGGSDELVFDIIEEELPDSATAKIDEDTVVILSLPENCSGTFSFLLTVTDEIDTDTVEVILEVTDSTPPLPPLFETPSIVNTATPTWKWKSGGNGGYGTYRLAVDEEDLSGDEAKEVDTTVYKPPKSLDEGVHTLFIQERDSSGNWSETASWELVIDTKAPDAPLVKGTTPTNDRTPTWTWIGTGAEEPLYRVKLDSAKFTSSDTTGEESFTPDESLEEGEHTLYVQESDAAGNWSKSGSYAIIVDLSGPQAPTVTGTTPTANRRPVWEWTSNGGGTGDYRCLMNSDDFDDEENEEDVFLTSALMYSASEDLSEDDHTLYVQEIDTAGNWSESGSFTITVDITPPGDPVISAPSATNDSMPEWSWESGGGGSGTFRYRLDSDNLTSEDATIGSSTSFIPSTNLDEGPHTFYLQEKDSTGNWSAIVSKVVVIDFTPPSAPELTGSSLTKDATPTWEWSPGGGGNGTYEFAIGSDDAVEVDSTAFTAEDGLSDDSYWVYCRERDAAGNWSSLDSFKTTVDLTPPDAPKVEGTALTNSPRPVWIWTPGGGGNGEYQYSLNSEDEWSATTSSTSFTPDDSLEDGIHTLYVRERDAAGNWSESGSSETEIDGTAAGAPVVHCPSFTNDDTPTWTWTADESMVSFRFKINNSDFSSGAETTTDTSYTPDDADPLGEGPYILYVQGVDEADNWSATGIGLVQVDLTEPASPVITAETPTNDATPTWSWEDADVDDPIDEYRLKIDDNDLTSGAVATDETSYAPNEDLSAGDHKLYLQGCDQAGNWSLVDSFTVEIDLTPPDAPSVTSTTTPTNNQRPTWTWTPEGGGNGQYRYTLGDEDAVETSSTNFSPDEDLDEGDHTLQVEERDDAGNWSEAGLFTITIDLTPPDAPDLTGTTPTNDATPTWSWTSGEGGSGNYIYRLDNSNIEDDPTSTSATSYTPSSSLTDGVHTLYIKEKDEAGNWSDVADFGITVDTDQPDAPIFISGTSSSPSSSSQITWKWEPGGGGNGTYKYSINSTSSGEVTVTSFSDDLSEGKYTFKVAERDDAGNWSSYTDSVVYYLPPPSDLAVTSGTAGVTLTWNNNATSDDSIFIYRAVDCTGDIKCRIFYTRIKALGPTATSYTDANVTVCETYRYYVGAYDKTYGMTRSEIIEIQYRPLKISCIDLPIDPILVPVTKTLE